MLQEEKNVYTGQAEANLRLEQVDVHQPSLFRWLLSSQETATELSVPSEAGNSTPSRPPDSLLGSPRNQDGDGYGGPCDEIYADAAEDLTTPDDDDAFPCEL